MHNSLFPRKFKDVNGVPYKVYYIKYTKPNGKIGAKSTGCRNKGDATKFQLQFNPKKVSGITLSTLRNEALNYSRNLGFEHHRQYKSLWDNFIKFTKDITLQNVTRRTIENYINYRKKSFSKKGTPYSACSINYEISIIKKSFEMAVENGRLEGNPARKIEKLQVTSTVPEFTLAEAQALLADLNTLTDKRYFQATLIAFNTGLRRDKIARLKWEDVDMINCEIHTNNKITKKPQFVTINPAVMEVLTKCEKRIDGFVFNLSPNYLYEVVKKSVKKLGLDPRLRFHSIRHTFITEAVKMFGIHIAKDMANHSEIKQTERYYHSRKNEIKAKAKELVI